MRKKEFYSVALVLLIFFLFGCPAKQDVPEEVPAPEKEEVVEESNITIFPPEEEYILLVSKGDTLIASFGKEILLVGIQAPSKYEPCFEESKNKLQELVVRKTVAAQRDVSDMNYYSRYLRYVFIDNIFINEFMVRNGLAKAVAQKPDVNYSDLLYEAEVDAISNRLCLWKDLEADPCLFVAYFNYDAEGVDEFNLNDEFVTFRNICKAKINMTGWVVQDSAEPYVFPEFFLGPEAGVTLHSGEGQDSDTHLYWNNEVSVWDDISDTLYLRNSKGNLIIRKHY